ncbi:MAG: divalent metal cation transporter [Candidatus Thermoplasmatota archaeon]|jgi:NRAMP (natural resistance-associated macrophage protein)-like metal ion transporter|nr:divalent metal cation transporter [Candidatus Thermoplasmatota archaeon]MCL5963434.1 divalent metal cation transporter [Candidatus Thermoplasmatota archaeon]
MKSARSTKNRIINFLRVMGPAWLVMIADVDVGSIITGIYSGSVFKYSMIFIELILIIPLFIIQDAAGRVSVATGKGIGELIRENFSKKIAIGASFPMAITDFLSYLAEYAGIAIGFEILGIPLLPAIIAVFFLHITVVVFKKYTTLEKIMLFISAIFIVFIIIIGILPGINLNLIFIKGLTPFQPYGNHEFTYLVIANIGAVIMPWMLFFQAGAAAEKGLEIKDIKHERLETLIGAIISELLMVGLVIFGINFNGLQFTRSSTIEALNKFSPYILTAFGITLIIAGFFALIIISMGSAWGVIESIGMDRKSKETTYIYMIESIPAVIVVLFFKMSLSFILDLMVIFVFVLLIPAVLLGIIIGNNTIMNGYAYKRWELYLYWITVITVVLAGTMGMFI